VPNAYQAELSKRLLGNLQSLKHVEAAAAAPGDGKGGDAVVYELYVLRLMRTLFACLTGPFRCHCDTRVSAACARAHV
jgi:hypothetical protein